MQRRAPYLYASPGGVAYSEGALFAWGLGAGLFLPQGDLLRTAGGFVEHQLFRRSYPGAPVPRIHADVLSGGAELRLGRARRRVFGYGVFRAGAELVFNAFPDSAGYARSSVLTSAGGGLLVALGRFVRVGGEVIGNATWFVHFADPSGAGDPPPVWGNLVARALIGFQY